MTPTLFRALRGPIFLIALGSLFAADQLGKFSLAQTWPALLILFGLLKLLERFASGPSTPDEPQQQGPFPGGTYPGSNMPGSNMPGGNPQ